GGGFRLGALTYYTAVAINTIIIAGMPLAAILWAIVRRSKWSKVRSLYGRILIVTGITAVGYMPAYLIVMNFFIIPGMAYFAMGLVLFFMFFVKFLLFTLLLKLKSREALITSLVGTILLYPFILLAMFCGFIYWSFFMMLWLSPLP
ncbi:MAG: hypothetical protein ACFE8O_08510, partial [Candidatus Hermodarchaeota archaeon]